ncbi:3-hydroxybutyryl-CoA dehydrogenase [Alkalihalobacillus xiaoxiensis]|uniref:3-hydroxybutyryl-CoA dehydrogenase n=1 Tax=Shouchella xiaoxiensis TaxID=766895 RepID=A0ABS2SZH9_9BACI|nr:3-hydroxybutyryl-CoA dehydrogenase [Shouchella xiaoxiensis]MBM7840616.1 3-hydroxybutyryl-CoA dehydrogenase [Shouchella xiaoxiensis]
MIKNVMVIGAGQMGAGIAEVFAAKGFSVSLHDREEALAIKGKTAMEARLRKLIAKGYAAEEDVQSTLEQIHPTADLSVANEMDLVIEAATENMEIKKQIFAELDQVVGPKTILATNTSSLPITDLASVTQKPERVIGMHFMNPVPRMKLVEVIRGLATTDDVFETIVSLSKQLDKVPVSVEDFPGFVSNRILMPMINEAIFTLYEGVASAEDIDTVMKLGMNHPMGPLTLADFIGLDTCLSIMNVLHEGFGDDKYRPCPLLKKYVQAGWLGKKSGRGFFQYE